MSDHTPGSPHHFTTLPAHDASKVRGGPLPQRFRIGDKVRIKSVSHLADVTLIILGLRVDATRPGRVEYLTDNTQDGWLPEAWLEPVPTPPPDPAAELAAEAIALRCEAFKTKRLIRDMADALKVCIDNDGNYLGYRLLAKINDLIATARERAP